MVDIPSATSESNPEIEAQTRLQKMFWSGNRADMVGKLLTGGSIDLHTSHNSRGKLWCEVREVTDFKTLEDYNFLLRSALSFQRRLPQLPEEKSQPVKGEQDSPEEYEWAVKKRSKVLISLIEPTLRKTGIWDHTEYRRIASHGGLRSEGKSNFSEEEQTGTEIKGNLYAPAEGGPTIRPVIYAPKGNSTKDITDSRVRRSLAHETVHIVRALTSKNAWNGFEGVANKYKLRRTKIAPTDIGEVFDQKKEKQKNVGGFYVGSNKQGSESVAELFSVVVEIKSREQREPTINDIFSEVQRRFIEKVDKFQKDSDTSYFVARFALLHHLKQLQDAGYGNTEAIGLVALGSIGYTSFEKSPALIELGVITKEKFDKAKETLTIISDWLSSQNT